MQIINDITGLNEVLVASVASPRSTEEVAALLRRTGLPVSIGGGKFSQGTQTASPGSLHIDLSAMNRILSLDPAAARIRVQAGIRWCDIQRTIDPHNLAVKVMQTYANFTVGGALSVNAHGRYIGFGPVVSSVRSIVLVLADGEVVTASRDAHADLFFAAIGGYGAIGVITEVELDLVPNTCVERHAQKMSLEAYATWFDANVRARKDVVFHNFDLYPPHYSRGRAVSWIETDKSATSPRLQAPGRTHPLARYLLWAITETSAGKARREFLYDPLIYARRAVHWRNYEAGYDVAELEPTDRTQSTYVLQEYFVPARSLQTFSQALGAVLREHGVNTVNVSVRHASSDDETLMSWARGDTFAFVLYYKQGTDGAAKARVGVWTRELVDAVLAAGGTYYLPYQMHAMNEQFHRAYPRAQELFAMKRELDPHYRLRGGLWDRYYAPVAGSAPSGDTCTSPSLFHAVYDDATEATRFHTFLKNVFDIVPPDNLHALIQNGVSAHTDDEAIYQSVQAALPGATPRLAMLTHALPSLARQKAVIGAQAAQLVGSRALRDYVEIGTTGRYVKALRRHLALCGTTTLVHDVEGGFSPVDIVERGGLRKAGTFSSLNGYAPLELPTASADLVSCFIGLHHMSPARLAAFLASIARVLRPGGVFLLREHDVQDPRADSFVALAHTVFNAGLGETWETNAAEARHFASIKDWIARVEAAGLRVSGPALPQDGDPTGNLMLAFVKTGDHA
ncbi:FAD-binding protein [Burkholderia sp. Ac-20365]|uniref:FAD-binding protein n=1 Tax=Burkholderia sp. Ac-20365 TaxID=2703897 RepID=UPI00197B602E|nr:FAD-binding protein [Burkholderia sp. Ac-20365]MBN3761214.1 FAD-binding protein [Burkholderia sp. Ac-20365]